MSLQKSYLMLRDLKLMVSWVPTHFEAAIAKARWAPPCCWKMASWKWRSRKRSVTPSSKSEWWLANLKSSVGPTWLGTVETLATGKTMDWHISTRTPNIPELDASWWYKKNNTTNGLEDFNIWTWATCWHLECLRCAVASWRHARVWTFQRCRLTALR